ncbi:hypothetical protein M2152_000415 [Microbacteriaceae bacterium SG_E_30_P1]|uniref:Alpha-amylase n=1 Tax=Antiquaquibacter oligotrophicus TaxID=2880260 RepID=A0ABT6KLA7_9MICO|nr:carboxypeptidase regulatory-like domain-containing protein [Antiquaquibacter oligotrophicus]MDH6180233.1 hypothetical protein [Antiquaquibacter oligotrophicus]UDF14020.1 carboxypeptidase-like regulatory domain-containing protein [Antiquaquibacter oligotrophicus]
MNSAIRRWGVTALAVAALTLTAGVAVPAVADDDPSDGDVTFEGRVTYRVAADGPPSDTGIPGLDVTVYVDDGTDQRPLGTLETDDNGRFELDVPVGDGEEYAFSVYSSDDDYFWSLDPLAIVTDLDDADWTSPPDDAPYVLGIWTGSGPTPTPTPTPTPSPTPTPKPTPKPTPTSSPTPVQTVSVSGTVLIAGSKKPIAGATVTVSVNGKGYGPVNTDTTGKYTLPSVPVGKAVIQAIAPGYSVDQRPAQLTAGTNLSAQDLFLVAKKPATSSNSIAGTVVLTGDGTDGDLFGGELRLEKDGETLQTTTAKDGAFVFENVKVDGDLTIVVAEVPEGYEQDAADGFVRNYAGTSVDHITIRLVSTADPQPAASVAGPDLTWLIVTLVVIVVAIAAVIIVLVIRRRRAA